MKLSKRIALWLSGWFLPSAIRLMGKTWRVRWRGRELIPPNGPAIFSIWHAHQLPLAYVSRNWGIVVLVSQSFDGELISRAIQKLGFRTVRGSSSRGGKEAFNSLLNELASGSRVAITPDGPRGPAYQISRGIITLAQKSHAKIFPVVVDASPSVRLKSWDKFMIPLPFAKVFVLVGEPVFVPREMEIDKAIKILQSAMNSPEDVNKTNTN